MPYSSAAIRLLSASVLVFASCVALVSCQGQQLVYRGTGINGSHDRADSNDDIIVIGGLFLVHDGKNSKCDHIRIDYIQRMEAMVLAIHKINGDDSLLPGVTLAYEIRDTCGNTNFALEQTLHFVTEGRVQNGKRGSVSGVIGPAFSFISTSVASLLRLFQIPQISFGATADTLSDKSRFDYFLRTVPPDSLQATAIADIIIHFNWTYVIVIFSDDVYGRGGITSLKNELELKNSSANVCIAATLAISDSTDYDQIVETIDQEWVANSSVIVMYAHLVHAECLLEAASQKAKIDKDFAKRNITWIGSDSWGGARFLKYSDLLSGDLHTTVQVPPNKEFEDHFLSLHPSNNSANPWFDEYWEEMFNCSLGVRRINVEECDLENQVLSQSKSYSHVTHVSLTTDAVYAFAHAIHKMQQDLCPGGRGLCTEILDQSNFLKGGAINGELLLKYLYKVSFHGASADTIEFDENGDVKGSYRITNLQKDTNGYLAYTPVGRWDGAGGAEQSIPLKFNKDIQWKHSLNGSDVPISICSQPCREGEYQQHAANQPECCWTCKPCEGTRQVSDGLECRKCDLGYRPNENRSRCVFIQPSFLRWSDPLAVILIMLAILGIAATTFVSVVFVVFNKEHIIKASSRELSAVLLCGIMLCYLLPFLYIAKPSPVLCAIRRLGVGFCFAVCFSSLLVKTNRIHRIFNRKSKSIQAPPLISPQSQLFFTAILVAIQMVIAIVWLIVEQPCTIFAYNDFNTDLLCGENPYIGFSVTLAYNLLLLIVTTYFAFRTRRVPQNFNEAKFINITVYSLCILWLAFIPMYFVSASVLRTSFQTASLIIAIILTATICLCCLLAPKIYFLFSTKQQKHSDQSHGSNSMNMDTFGSNRKLNTTAYVLRDQVITRDQKSDSSKITQIDASVQTEN
jgi:metabotropic glutamate receptor 2/3